MYIARDNNGDYRISREPYKKIKYKVYPKDAEPYIIKDWEVKRKGGKCLNCFEGKNLIGHHIRKGTQIEI